MEVERFDIEGLVAMTPRRFKDERGLFFESFNHRVFEDVIGRTVNFVQDNESHSKKDVLRGLHFQAPPSAQGKLVRVVKGAVLDVVVDLRPGSSTFGQHQKVELTEKNGKEFWIPKGFAHGFLTLVENTIFQYKCTDYYDKKSEMDLLWNDPDLNIDWGATDVILSEKDMVATKFSDFINPF